VHWSGRHSHVPSLHSVPSPHTAPPGPQLHAPFTQRSACAEPHAVHGPPPVPHAALDGTRHGPLADAQHPSAHELPVHTHAPATHESPAAHCPELPQRQLPPGPHRSARPGLQVLHAAPLTPHTSVPPSVTVPDVWFTHALPWQHPMQLVLVHMHTPPTHSCPGAHGDAPPHLHTPEAQLSPSGAQLAHCAADAPHTPTLCPLKSTQASPWQHPAQLVASHTQLPPTQCCPAAQRLLLPHLHCPPTQLSARTRLHGSQNVPFRPQLLMVCPVSGTHVPALQHPFGQLVALHPSHCWLRQLPLHAWQLTPPPPQAPFCVPGMHWPPWQHPGQLFGSHSHAPLRHTCPGPQGLALGPAPHTQAPPVQRSASVALHAAHAPPGAPQEPNVGASTHCPL
jgi:hypothetical protein